MENQGVKCCVNKCRYNCCDNKCTLEKIEITDMKTGANCVETPHFCKSYEEK